MRAGGDVGRSHAPSAWGARRRLVTEGRALSLAAATPRPRLGLASSLIASRHRPTASRPARPGPAHNSSVSTTWPAGEIAASRHRRRAVMMPAGRP